MSRSVEVVDHTGGGLAAEPIVALVTAVLDVEEVEGSVVVAFVDEAVIEDLNTRYREAPESTDVLSFRYLEDDDDWPEPEVDSGPTSGGEPELGEIVICPRVVRRYAGEEGTSSARQLGWTLIHGTLHLIGYDHETDEGQMRAREQALLEALAPMIGPDLLLEVADASSEG